MKRFVDFLLISALTMLAITLAPAYLPVIGQALIIFGKTLGLVFTYNKSLFLGLSLIISVLLSSKTLLK